MSHATNRLLLVFALYMLVNPEAAAQRAAAVIPDQYIVVLRDGANPQGFLRRYAVAPEHVYEHAVNGFAAKLPAPLLARVFVDPAVKYVEPVREAWAFAELQNGVDRVDAELNPATYTSGNKDIDVAVLDTGVNNYTASKVKELNYGPSYTAVTWEKGTADNNGHGTHVAGIIGAYKNGRAVAGVCPGARIWNVKVLDRTGGGTTASVLAGINRVAAYAGSIEVANMSLGTSVYVQSWRDGILAAQSKGVVFVVAAGNSNTDAATFSPAGYPEVITVSAIVDTDGKPGFAGPASSYGLDDYRATFSNCGAVVDIAAPGVDIWSLSNRNGFIAKMSGTSQASPHVAGAVAQYIFTHLPRPADAGEVALVRDALLAGAWPQTHPSSFLDNSGDGSPEPLLKAGPDFEPPAP